MTRWIAWLFAGAGAMALCAAALTTLPPSTSTTTARAAEGSTPASMRQRIVRGRTVGADQGFVGRAAGRHRFASDVEVDDAHHRGSDDPDALRDASALVRFDAAFAAETRDREWSDATEQGIRTTLATMADAPVLEAVDCRSTLCRVELRGSADTLPAAAPFDGITWWIEGEGGRAQLLLVRDGAEIPLPTED